MKFDYSSIIIITGLLLINSAHSQNLLNGPEDIIFDNKHNRILVSNWASGAIVAIDSSFNLFKTSKQFPLYNLNLCLSK